MAGVSRRVAEAHRLGFSAAFIPKNAQVEEVRNVELRRVDRIARAVEWLSVS